MLLPPSGGKPEFYCMIWEDNRNCIKVAESPEFTPITKHIALKYHHSRQFMLNKTVHINPNDTLEQNADIFTKPLADVKFAYLRKKVCGWRPNAAFGFQLCFCLRGSVRLSAPPRQILSIGFWVVLIWNYARH